MAWVSPVRFFAANDGVYELTVTAVDKDGGITSVNEDIFVSNVNPTFGLSGAMQNGTVNLNLVITDPGQELFTVRIYWTTVNPPRPRHFSPRSEFSRSAISIPPRKSPMSSRLRCR